MNRRQVLAHMVAAPFLLLGQGTPCRAEALPTAELEGLLQLKRPDYFGALQPGASRSALQRFEEVMEAPLPQAFRDLYSWRNGQIPSCTEPLHRNRMFMPLEEILETKEMLDGMIGFDFKDPKYWRKGWVPFLSNGAGSYLCLDLLAKDGGAPGQLVAFWKADADRPIEYPSVRSWMDAVIESVRLG